jgi:beta-lactamase class D
VESRDKVLGWFIGWMQQREHSIIFAYHDVYTWTGANPGKLAQDAAIKKLLTLRGKSPQ